jgi:hypothetical protein
MKLLFLMNIKGKEKRELRGVFQAVGRSIPLNFLMRTHECIGVIFKFRGLIRMIAGVDSIVSQQV